MIKKVVGAIALTGAANAATATQQEVDQMKVCLQDYCPTQYLACKNYSGCENKITNCALNTCGVQVNQSCWVGCIGIFTVLNSAYQDVLFCGAANCFASVESPVSFEQIGRAIDEYLRSE